MTNGNGRTSNNRNGTDLGHLLIWCDDFMAFFFLEYTDPYSGVDDDFDIGGDIWQINGDGYNFIETFRQPMDNAVFNVSPIGRT